MRRRSLGQTHQLLPDKSGPYSPFRSANLGNFNAKKHTKIAKDAKKAGVWLVILRFEHRQDHDHKKLFKMKIASLTPSKPDP